MNAHQTSTRRRVFEGLLLASALLVVVLSVGAPGPLPPWATVLLFGGLVFAAENAAVVMPSLLSVSPGFMLETAVVTVLVSLGYPLETVVLGGAVVGLFEGLTIEAARARRWSILSFNCSQFLLSSAAAGAAYFLATDVLGGVSVVVAPIAAVAVYGTVNIGCVVVYLALRYGEAPRTSWAEVRPTLPNSLAFGLLGVFVGELYLELGPLALPLILTPAAIARATFSSYLQLKRAHDTAVNVFVRAIEAKDRYTAGHCERVAKYAAYIGEELGFTPAQLEHLRYAALMHDIGKLAVPSSLLNKPGKLTPDEWELVRRHNDVCIDILTRVDFLRSTVPAASDKHAHYGKGEERDDPEALEAYAIAVADAFDAMTSTRSYRRALTQDVAFAELRECAGVQFHPASVEALISAVERRGEIYGLGFEADVEDFAVAPPVVGVGSAGLGDLLVDAGGAC